MLRASAARRPSGGPSGLMLALKSRISSWSRPARWANSRRFPPCLFAIGHLPPPSGPIAKHDRRHGFHDLADGAERVAGRAADLPISVGRQGQRAGHANGPDHQPPPAQDADAHGRQNSRRPNRRPARPPTVEDRAESARPGVGQQGHVHDDRASPGQRHEQHGRPERAGRQRGQRGEFQQEQARDRDHAHRADVAVLHDFQDSLPRAGTEKPSAVSASPSRCRQPEKLKSTTTSTAAASRGGAAQDRTQASPAAAAAQQQADQGKPGTLPARSSSAVPQSPGPARS